MSHTAKQAIYMVSPLLLSDSILQIPQQHAYSHLYTDCRQVKLSDYAPPTMIDTAEDSDDSHCGNMQMSRPPADGPPHGAHLRKFDP